MRKLWFVVMVLPMVMLEAVSSDVSVGLQALQQIRTLIPERLSSEEFSILVDAPAFQKSFQSMTGAEDFLSCRYYFSYWTIAGEAVRLLDSYQQFEYGPFWLYPTALHALEEMEEGS